MEMTFAPEHRAFRDEVRAWIAEAMPHCRRLEKYFPRERSGTMSAIQLSHAGPPTAPALCINRIKPMKTRTADELSHPRPSIQRGTSAMGSAPPGASTVG